MMSCEDGCDAKAFEGIPDTSPPAPQGRASPMRVELAAAPRAEAREPKVVLDTGCTKAMVSRRTAERFIAAVRKAHFRRELPQSPATFRLYAFMMERGALTAENMKLELWFTRSVSAEWIILDQGVAPMLVSIAQLRRLKADPHMGHIPPSLSVECAGYHRAFALGESGNRHLRLDLGLLQKAV